MTQTLARRVAKELNETEILAVAGGYSPGRCMCGVPYTTDNGEACYQDYSFVEDICP